MTEEFLENVVIEELREVSDEVVEAWTRLMPQLSQSATAPTKEWLEEIIHSDSVMFFARLDGILVGSLTLVLTKIPVGMKAWMEDVVVDECARGKRIGDQLTCVAIERAQQAGARSVNLTSHPSRTPAHKLYKRVGFRERNTTVYRFAECHVEAEEIL